MVGHLHLPPPIRQPSWLNALMRRSAAAIAPSVDTANRWIARAGLDPARVSVIPTGIDVDRFVPLPRDERMAVRAGVDVGEEEPMVIFAGRLERIKGPHFLVDAVARLNANVHLVLCGASKSPSYLRELQSLAQGYRVSSSGLGRTFLPLWRPPISPFSRAYFWRHKVWLSASRWPAKPQSWPRTSVDLVDHAGVPEQLVPPGDPVAWRRPSRNTSPGDTRIPISGPDREHGCWST